MSSSESSPQSTWINNTNNNNNNKNNYVRGNGDLGPSVLFNLFQVPAFFTNQPSYKTVMGQNLQRNLLSPERREMERERARQKWKESKRESKKVRERERER